MTRYHSLSILQYNVKKSKGKVMIPFFKKSSIHTYNILAIQKPWRNFFQHITNNCLSQVFKLSYILYLATRVNFFIHKRLVLSIWNVTHHTLDFSTLEICTSNTDTIYIHSIYNFYQQSRNSSLISTIIDQQNGASSNIEHILLGNFDFYLFYGLDLELQ